MSNDGSLKSNKTLHWSTFIRNNSNLLSGRTSSKPGSLEISVYEEGSNLELWWRCGDLIKFSTSGSILVGVGNLSKECEDLDIKISEEFIAEFGSKCGCWICGGVTFILGIDAEDVGGGGVAWFENWIAAFDELELVVCCCNGDRFDVGWVGVAGLWVLLWSGCNLSFDFSFLGEVDEEDFDEIFLGESFWEVEFLGEPPELDNEEVEELFEDIFKLLLLLLLEFEEVFLSFLDSSFSLSFFLEDNDPFLESCFELLVRFLKIMFLLLLTLCLKPFIILGKG